MTVKKETDGCRNSSHDEQAGSGLAPKACCVFEIRVKGQLSELWVDWFEGLTIEQFGDEEMILSGPIVDQAALMGVLAKLSRLNLTLISINESTKTQKETK